MNEILKIFMENMKKWTNNIIVYRKYLILITFSSKIELLHAIFRDLCVMHDRAKLANISRVFTGQVGSPTYKDNPSTQLGLPWSQSNPTRRIT